jgi:hypothetical protein
MRLDLKNQEKINFLVSNKKRTFNIDGAFFVGQKQIMLKVSIIPNNLEVSFFLRGV